MNVLARKSISNLVFAIVMLGVSAMCLPAGFFLLSLEGNTETAGEVMLIVFGILSILIAAIFFVKFEASPKILIFLNDNFTIVIAKVGEIKLASIESVDFKLDCSRHGNYPFGKIIIRTSDDEYTIGQVSEAEETCYKLRELVKIAKESDIY